MNALRSGVALLGLLSIVTLTGIMLGRAVTTSKAELEAAEGYRQDKQLAQATEHYRRALRWSFPFSPFRDQAVSGLESVATELEDSRDRAGALLAWRSLVGGLAASRFLYSQTDPNVEQAKGEIARLIALQGGAAIDANLDPDKLAADHRRLLERQVSPHPLWGTVLLLGFALWIGSLLLVINRGFDTAGKFLWPAARLPLSSALAGLVSFVIGLLLA